MEGPIKQDFNIPFTSHLFDEHNLNSKNTCRCSSIQQENKLFEEHN